MLYTVTTFSILEYNLDMIKILLVSFSLLWVLCVVVWLADRASRARRNGAGIVAEFVGICASALDQSVRKEGNKKRVLALLEEKGELGNQEIREVLGVSGSTIARYMDELETVGKVEQVGGVGRGVTYRLR